jgi:hypothetical protein
MTAGMNVPMIVFHNGSKSRNILPLQNKFSLTRTRSQSVRRHKKAGPQNRPAFDVYDARRVIT